MRKIVAAFKVSLDLKYQGAGDYADWVDGWSEDYGLTLNIDACIVGGAMYRGYEGYWSAMMDNPGAPSPMTGQVPTTKELDWAAVIPSIPHYIFTRSEISPLWHHAQRLSSLADIAALKAKSGKDIYLMGGGMAFNALLDHGLVDELRLIIYPILAGGPHDLFASRAKRTSAELVRTQQLTDDKVRLDYRFSY